MVQKLMQFNLSVVHALNEACSSSFIGPENDQVEQNIYDELEHLSSLENEIDEHYEHVQKQIEELQALRKRFEALNRSL